MWMVAGLGNPGVRYAMTRHNAGFLVLKELVRRWDAPASRTRAGANVVQAHFHGQRVILATPQLFMNRSGLPISALLAWYDLSVENLLVVHDDMDLPFGRLRLKLGGGHAGHRGVRDIQSLSGAGFFRLRFGISRPPPEWDPARYVLSSWSPAELSDLPAMLQRAAHAVETVLVDGPGAAANRFNVKPRGKGSSGGAKIAGKGTLGEKSETVPSPEQRQAGRKNGVRG